MPKTPRPGVLLVTMKRRESRAKNKAEDAALLDSLSKTASLSSPPPAPPHAPPKDHATWITTPVTAVDAVRYLNELVALDPDALHTLMECRTPCNMALLDHPTAQVTVDAEPRFGLLGLLNGLFGVRKDGWGHIFAEYGDDGRLLRFTVNRKENR